MWRQFTPNYTTHAKRPQWVYPVNPDPIMKRARSSNVSQRLQTSRDSGNLGISSGFNGLKCMNCGCSWVKTRIPWSVGYLEAQQRQAVITWLQTKTTGTSPNCKGILQQSTMVFDSKQSYYSLFEEAGISWKKHRNVIPNPELVKKKRQEITDWLAHIVPRLSLAVGGLLRRWMPPAMGRSLRLCLG